MLTSATYFILTEVISISVRPFFSQRTVFTSYVWPDVIGKEKGPGQMCTSNLGQFTLIQWITAESGCSEMSVFLLWGRLSANSGSRPCVSKLNVRS